MKKEIFCKYIKQYETDMFRFAKSIVGNQADGEDAIHINGYSLRRSEAHYIRNRKIGYKAWKQPVSKICKIR